MAQNPLLETKNPKNIRTKTKTKRPAVCCECGRVWGKDINGKRKILLTCPECETKKKIFSKLRIL